MFSADPWKLSVVFFCSGKVGMNLYWEQGCNIKVIRFVNFLYRGRDIGQLSLKLSVVFFFSGKVGMNLYWEQSCNVKVIRFVALVYRK